MNDFEIQNRLIKYYDNWEKKKQIVTIFLLTHKRPYYVSLMIDSILKQTYSNFYLIILDNMSGDKTREVIESFNDERIIYIERESNLKTAVSNYKFAFLTCRTKYLNVFHDDDLLCCNYLKEMINIMNNNDTLCLLSPSFNIIDENGNTITTKKATELIIFKDNQYFYRLFSGEKSKGYLLIPACLYKHSFYKDLDKFTNRMAGPSGDEYLYLQSERYGGVMANCSLVLFNYRLHKNQESNINSGRMTLQLVSFLTNDEYYWKLLDTKKRSDFVDVCLRLFIRAINYNLPIKEKKSLLKKMWKVFPKKLFGCKYYTKMVFCHFSCYFPRLSLILFNHFLGKRTR